MCVVLQMDWDSKKCLELIGLYEKKAEVWQPDQTLLLSFHASVVASQTSGIIFDIDGFEIRKRHMRLAYESPIAKNLKVKANRTNAGILSR